MLSKTYDKIVNSRIYIITRLYIASFFNIIIKLKTYPLSKVIELIILAENCLAVMPFTEVLRHHQPSDEKDIVNFTAKIENYRVLFYFNKDFTYGDTLAYTYGNQLSSNENLLLNYGIVTKNNKFNTDKLEVNIKKKHFNENKALVCQQIKCTNVDIFSMLDTTGQRKMNLYYELSLDKLSIKLLNVFKLISIPNNKFNPEKLFYYFLAEARLDFNTESLAVVNYYKAISKKDKQFETVLES